MKEPSAELERFRLEQRARSGANWFYWIAALSLINSISQYLGASWGFVIGLGITQIVDTFFREKAADLILIAFLFDLIVGGIFLVVGYLARRSQGVFIAGLVFYGIDTLIFLLIQEWVGLAFHIFVGFSIFAGYKASNEIKRTPKPVVPADIPPLIALPAESTSPLTSEAER